MTKLSQCLACKKKFVSEYECEFYNPIENNYCDKYELPYDNSKGMFKNVFSFKGRIRRTEYGLTYLGYWLFCLPMNLVSEENLSADFAIVWLLLYIPILWIILAQGAKRCHDRGNNFLFQFIPFYIFWLIFADGDETVNRYGTSPKKSYQEQIYRDEMKINNKNI